MSLAIKCLKESLAKPNLSKKVQQILKERLIELEERELKKQQAPRSKTKKASPSRSISSYPVFGGDMGNLSKKHPVLGDVGNQLKEIVNKAAVFHYKKVPRYSLITYQDMWQAGMLGALKALGRYDLSKGASLQTFLFKRVTGEIQDLLRSVDHLKRKQRDWIKKIYEKHDELIYEMQTEISRVTAAWNMGKKYKTALELASLLSLEGPSPYAGKEAKHAELLETIPSDSIDPFEAFAIVVRRKKLWELLEALPERERIIATLYSEGATLVDIGSVFGLSESRISQIRTKTLKKLRWGLKDY